MTTLSGTNWRWIACLVLFSTVMGTFAHPGHDLFSQGPAHVAKSGYHVAVLLLSGSCMLVLAQFIRSKPRAQQMLRIVGAMAMVAGAVFWGTN